MTNKNFVLQKICCIVIQSNCSKSMLKLQAFTNYLFQKQIPGISKS